MIRPTLAIAVLALLGPGIPAQEQDAPAPTPLNPPGLPALLPPPPLPCMSPGYVPCAPYEDHNGPLLRFDPLLDGDPAPGWFGSLEADLVVPRFKYALTAPVNVAGFSSVVNVPLAPLDWTGAPRVELGYRFAQGYGDVLLAYRSLVTCGCMEVPNYDFLGHGVVHSRLNMNTVDIDYASRETTVGEVWDARWQTGVRLANLYVDSEAHGRVRHENSSNYFFGAGPHAGTTIQRYLGESGWSILTRADVGVTMGRISQSFGQSFTFGGMPAIGGAAMQRGSQAVPMLHVQAGVKWRPPWPGSRMHFETGYELERWWAVGQLNESSAYLWIQGMFFRAAWNY